MRKLLKKSLLCTFFVHLALFILFMIGFVLNKEKYGDEYINEGIYFNFLFLQFFPITFALIFSLCLYIIGLSERINRNEINIKINTQK